MLKTSLLLLLISAASIAAAALDSAASFGTSGVSNKDVEQLTAFRSMRNGKIACPSPAIGGYVQNALDYYAGTSDAQGIAQRVTNNVVQVMAGNWQTLAMQKKTGVQWAYWGSQTVYTAKGFCFYETDDWIVLVVKVQVDM